MKNRWRTTAVILGFALITLSGSQHSSAVLGLSKCEKMVKSVQSQDRLTCVLWSNYHRERKLITYSKKGEELSYLLDRPASEILQQSQIKKSLTGMALDINRSGLKSLNLMKAQSSCFTVATYSKLINETTRAQRYVLEWQSAYKSKSSTQIDFRTVFPSDPKSFLKVFPVK